MLYRTKILRLRTDDLARLSQKVMLSIRTSAVRTMNYWRTQCAFGPRRQIVSTDAANGTRMHQIRLGTWSWSLSIGHDDDDDDSRYNKIAHLWSTRRDPTDWVEMVVIQPPCPIMPSTKRTGSHCHCRRATNDSGRRNRTKLRLQFYTGSTIRIVLAPTTTSTTTTTTAATRTGRYASPKASKEHGSENAIRIQKENNENDTEEEDGNSTDASCSRLLPS